MSSRKRESTFQIVIPVKHVLAKAGIYVSNCHSCGFLAGIHKPILIMKYYVYILSSKKNGTLYIGVTSNLLKRVYEHKNNLVDGFTKKYHVHQLVYYEKTNEINTAIAREKQIKKWKRQWKIELIEKFNPDWQDFYYDFLDKYEFLLKTCP